MATDAGNKSLDLLLLAIGSLLIVFSMWWLYFSPENRAWNRAASTSSSGVTATTSSSAPPLRWAPACRSAIDYETNVAHTSDFVASMAVAVPVAIYLMSVWVLRVLPAMHGPIVPAVPAAALLILICTLVIHTTLVVGIILVALVALMIAAARKHEPD